MGSHSNPSKRHYDITMSKRTRKPLNLQEANRQNSSSKWDIPLKSIAGIFDQSSPRKGTDHEEELLDGSDRKSLKQLINGDENAKSGTGRGSASTSLGHHFTEEEKQLQLVKKQQQQDNGVKLKGMMNRYAKVLSHLVKVKREPRKKHLLRLTM